MKTPKSEQLTALSALVNRKIQNGESPETILPILDSAINVALGLGGEEKTLTSMYETRAYLLGSHAATKKVKRIRECANQHHYGLLGKALREYLRVKEAEA